MAARVRARGLRTLPWLAVLVALVVALVWLAGAAVGEKRASWSFGPLAGYIWEGQVESVQASWTVPRIVAGSSPGVASTWVGAAASGVPRGFIQIGTSEAAFSPSHALGSSRYYAFWSDGRLHFHPILLFRVSPGDNLTASVTLVRQRWTLAVVDASSGAAAHFATRNESQASFNLAEWAQEDVTNGATGRPYPYPRLAAVALRDVTVNSVPPTSVDLYSSWMSVDGNDLAPSSLHNDSFTLRRATVSVSGAQYLRIAAGDDAATVAFVAQLRGWAATTPTSKIESACARFLTALRTDIDALVRAPWPLKVHSALDLLIRNTRTAFAYTRSAVPLSSAGRAAWRSGWMRDAAAVGSAAHAVKRVLDVPEIIGGQ
jgi:hypothetical protein